MNGIKDESAFIKLIKAAASSTGQTLNLKGLALMCGKDEKTAKAWLSVLESSGLAYLLEPYYGNANKRLIRRLSSISLTLGLLRGF